MEEGRRWKKGGEGGIRRGIKWFRGDGFLGIFLESSWENFQGRTESKKGWNREMRKLEEGVNSRGEKREGSCYPVYRYVGSGARKPVGFLGPAGLLVRGGLS